MFSRFSLRHIAIVLHRTLFGLALPLAVASQRSEGAVPSGVSEPAVVRPANVVASGAVRRTGFLTGRVVNAGTGENLERVRVRVEDTSIEVFSDAEGRYVLPEMPVGTVRLRFFYTGLRERIERIEVVAGEQAERMITLDAAPAEERSRSGGQDVIELAAFTVSTSRELAAAAVAIHEQRFATNTRNVLATDEFGFLAEGNTAEFLKFMPGITVESTGGNSRDITLNGVPSAYVPITVEGFDLASAGVEINMGRSVAMDMVSVNNLSRIEVQHSPLAEHSGSGLAGTINLVPRSAFERSRPVFHYRTFLMGRSNEFDFSHTPGPDLKSSRKINPGFEFSWIVPVNRSFGYTLTAGYSTNYSPEPLAQMRWHGAFTGTNAAGAAGAAYPATSPAAPYLTNFIHRDAGKTTTRASVGTTLDFRLGRADRVSFGFQASDFKLIATNQTLEYPIDRVAQFTPTSTVSVAGQGRLQLSNLVRHRDNRTTHPTLVWYHNGPLWKGDAGFGLSQADNLNRDIDKGAFSNTTATRNNLTIIYSDIGYDRPGRITVTDAITGLAVDPHALEGKTLVSAASVQDAVSDKKMTAYANLGREISWRVPLNVKGGLRFSRSERENRGTTSNWTYLGPDLNAATPDGADAFPDPVYSARQGLSGFPPIQGVGNYLAYDRLRADPRQFRLDENNQYRTRVSNSKRARETIAAAYLQAGVAGFDRRLKIDAGLRAEQTNISASGALQDPTRNFQRDAAGNVLRGANGQPLLLKPTTDALGVSQLTFIERGTHAAKEYLRLLPRINASFLLRENLVLRGAFSTSLGRPNMNQYAGALTLPNLEAPPSPNNVIFVNNPGIKAWSAESKSLRLEYYFPKVGQLSVGVFRREYRNFFGGVRLPTTPEFLAHFDLDPVLYGDYDVQTQANLPGIVRNDGLTIDYKQALTFLPVWIQGVQVFANATRINRTGTGSLLGYMNPFRDTANWGVLWARSGHSLRLNWNYRDRRANSLISGNSIGPDTYNYTPRRLTLDLDAEMSLSRGLGFFLNVRNLTNVPELQEVYGPATPAHARMRLRIDYGALLTFGVKGTF